MAYLCVTCVPFNSQHKCFSALDSTARVSLRKAKQRLSALLIRWLKDANLPPVHGQSRAPRAWHNTTPFGLIQLINSILIPNTLQQCFPVFFPSQGPGVPCCPTQCHLPLAPVPLRLGLGQGGCTLLPRDTVWQSMAKVPKVTLATVTQAQYFISMLKCFKEFRNKNSWNCCVSQNLRSLY